MPDMQEQVQMAKRSGAAYGEEVSEGQMSNIGRETIEGTGGDKGEERDEMELWDMQRKS